MSRTAHRNGRKRRVEPRVFRSGLSPKTPPPPRTAETTRVVESQEPAPKRKLPTLKALAKRIEYMRALMETQALESSYSWLDPDGFAGSDALERLWRQKGVTGSGELGWVPFNLISDRKDGKKWPLWNSEVELNGIRANSRLCYEDNPYGTGLVNSLVNYAIGKGFTYRFQLKLPKDPVAAANLKKELTQQNLMEPYKKLAQRAQDWLDEFLKFNRFTSSIEADEDECKVSATREVEAFIRLLVDGDSIFRLFRIKGGMAAVRFVEPVRIINPPNKSFEDGWSYGVQHAVYELDNDDGPAVLADEETIVAINIQNQDQIEIDHNEAGGEVVEADEIVWLMPRTEASNVKRGTPLLSFGLLEALNRAYAIQSNASKSAAWRAATVEIWKNLQGNQGSVQSIAQANGRVVQDATGQSRIQQRIKAPAIRDLGPGREPVTPTAVGYNEYLDVAQGDLRQAGAPNSVPEFMISGDASNNNYASIKEAGAPFFVNNTITQEHLKRSFSAVIKKAHKIAVEGGRLPQESLRILELVIEAPKDDTRSPLDRASEDNQLIQAHIKSPQTCQAERGLDTEQEFQNFEEVEQRFGPAGGAGGDQGGGGFDSLLGGDGGPTDDAGGLEDGQDDQGASQEDGSSPPAPVLASIEPDISLYRESILTVESLEDTETLEECLSIIGWTGSLIDGQGRILEFDRGEPNEGSFLESEGCDYDPDLCDVIPLLENVDAGWKPLMGTRGVKKGQQVGWINSKGRKVYGLKKPGNERNVTAKRAPGKEGRAGDASQVHSTIQEMLTQGATEERGKFLLDKLSSMTVAELKAIKAKYNLDVSGRLKKELMDGIAAAANKQAPQGAELNAISFAKNLDKIRMGEKESGVPWVQRVMDYMPAALKDYNISPDTDYAERWSRLKNGDFPAEAIQKLLDNPELKHDYGTLTPQQFADVLPMIDFSKWTKEGGGKGLKTGGTATEAGQITDDVVSKLKKKKPEYQQTEKALPKSAAPAPARKKGETPKEKKAREFGAALDQIQWKEKQGGGSFLTHLLAHMPAVFQDANISADTPFAERFKKLREGLAHDPRMEKLLNLDEVRDVGRLSPEQFQTILPHLKMSATPWSRFSGQSGARGELSGKAGDPRTEADKGFLTDATRETILAKNPQLKPKTAQQPGTMSDEASAKAIQRMLDRDRPFNPLGAKFDVPDRIGKLANKKEEHAPATGPDKRPAETKTAPKPAPKAEGGGMDAMMEKVARTKGDVKGMFGAGELDKFQTHLYSLDGEKLRDLAGKMNLANHRGLSKTKAVEAIMNKLAGW